MRKFIRKYSSLNKIINKLKRKSTIFRCSICLSVVLLLFMSYNFGKDINFGLDDISFVKLNSLTNSSSHSESADEITSVVINWHNGDISIDSTSSSKISATEYSENSLTSSEKLVFEQNGEELVISFNSEYGFFNSPVQIQKDLEISLPDTVESLTIKTVNSDIYISDIQFEDLKINVDISNLTVKDSIISSLDINTESGNLVLDDILVSTASISSKNAYQDIKNVIITDLSTKSQEADIDISGDVYKADISSVYGDINFKSDVEMDNLSLNSSVGNIEASVPSNSGFILKTNLGLGQFINEDFNIVTTDENVQYYKNSYVTNEYEFSTSKGTVTLSENSYTSSALNYEEYMEEILEEEEE